MPLVHIALAMFPISEKKYKVFSGIFAQIFHKCKTAFNSGIFHFKKRKMVFNSGVFCGVVMTFFFVNDMQNAESSGFVVQWFFLRSPCKSHRKYRVGGAMTFLFFELCVEKRRQGLWLLGVNVYAPGHQRWKTFFIILFQEMFFFKKICFFQTKFFWFK